jgi:hypothetical protein
MLYGLLRRSGACSTRAPGDDFRRRAERCRATLYDRERLVLGGRLHLRRLDGAAAFLLSRVREVSLDERRDAPERACLVTALMVDFGYDCPGPDGARRLSCEEHARRVSESLDLEAEEKFIAPENVVAWLLALLQSASRDGPTRLERLVLIAALCRWLERRCRLPRLPGGLPTYLPPRELLELQVLRMRVDFLRGESSAKA